MRLLRFARNDENSRIPKHRDPTVKPWDDTRTPWDDTRTPWDDIRTPGDDGYLGDSRIPFGAKI